MSGDVQPRKRKDKKRKKDDLGVTEPRGTSAALGEGDLFMHSQHDHGTGGHWCAKVIFFSLLAVLVGLIGLIILENRGLSELEANSVQSQYSGVLEGWLEDAPDDDHHDSHTLELNHHDDEDEEHGDEVEHSEEEGDDHDDDGDAHDDGSHEDDENAQDDEDETQDDEDEDGSQEQDLEENDEEEDLPYRKYYHENAAEPDDDDEESDNTKEADDDEENDNTKEDEDDDENDNTKEAEDDEEHEELSREGDQDDDDDDDDANNQSLENEGDDTEENDVNEYNENNEAESEENNNEDEEHDEEEEEDASLEVEKIEHEVSEEEPVSAELPVLPEADDDDDDNKAQESVEDETPDADDEDDEANEPDDDYLEADDDEPPVERITAPAGKPFVEEEEETSSEKPTDTLAEEEEYEKRQEELRKEEAASSHMWLKLSVGGALLVATHAIVRRATASSDTPTEERVTREATPIDRRMTLIPEEPTESVPIRKVTQESTRPVIQEVTKQIPSIVKSSPTYEDSEEEVEEEEEPEEPVVPKVTQAVQSAVKQELYSDEEDEEVEEEEKPVEMKAVPQVAKPPTPEPDDDVPDDVEIIEDEQIEEEAEEVEEDEDEEEISDVDDEELLTRLEAKYGRLPEPERPQRRKDGGNSIEDEWPGEPSDAYWRQQLDQAEEEFNQGAWLAAAERVGAKQLRSSARARLIAAQALDAAAEKRRDNALLGRAITSYLELLKMNERLTDARLLNISERTINRIQFRGNYLNAEPVYRLLIRRFPDDPSHRTNLTVMFLMANRPDLAENVLKETLQRWPDDRLALAQYGFVLKTQHNRLEEAAEFLQRALDGDTGPATEPRYYYHLGDTFLLLGRFKEAQEVHERAAAHGHFLSAAQRSLYNVPRLKGQPWWKIEDTPYVKLTRALEKSWRAILREGEAARALYEQEKEGLKERGEWSQLDLFARGREIPGRCERAPVTCAIVRSEANAAGCRRGQVKFSSMRAGTHVRAHVGPTNCRLRMHLGLSNTKDTFIRVDRETRQWQEGKVFIFDDSFEHEVWHNGTGSRLVLIVDVWHPELTAAERRQLPAI